MSHVTTDTDQLLQYIRILYERRANRAAKTGITVWAVLAALIYLAWRSIPQLIQLSTNRDSIYSFLLLYSHIQIFLVALYLCFPIGGDLSPKSRFDYRISRQSEKDVLLQLGMIFSAGIGLPVFAGWLAARHLSLSHFHLIQISINTYALSGFALFIVIASAGINIYQRISEYPFPTQLSSDRWLGQRIFNSATWLLFFELCIGNAVAVSVSLPITAANWNAALVELAVNSALLALGIIALSHLLSADAHLERLAKLERDIVIHELSPEKIRARLELDVVGQDVSEWLKSEIDNVKAKADELRAHTKQIDQLSQEVAEIEKQYSYERTGRIKKYVDEMQDKLNIYSKRTIKLQRWLTFTAQLPQILVDQYISELLQKTTTELESTLEAVKTEVKAAVTKIERVMQSMTTETSK